MLRRLILWLILLVATAAGGMVALKQDHAASWAALFERYRGTEKKQEAEDQIRLDLLDQLNHVRLSNDQAWLKHDPELSAWLDSKLDSDLNLGNLDPLCVALFDDLPRYTDVAAGAASGPSMEIIKERFHDFIHELKKPNLTHVAFGIRDSAAGFSNEVVVMVVQRLKDFSPELLHRTHDDAFFAVCPHCDYRHAIKAMRGQNSSTLECPSCTKVYAMIAADSQGRFHYVNEFLTGYQPEAIYPPGQSRIEQLFAIWSAVHASCRYTRDPGKNRQQTDSWQVAMETQTLGQGDCEDSALLLTDWLIARGYEARVALGKYGEIGGHAWTIVRVDQREYLLESTTEGNPDYDRPPLASRIGSRYVPEVMFDRWALYVRRHPLQAWDGDYWSDESWIRLEARDLPDRSAFARTAPALSSLAKPLTPMKAPPPPPKPGHQAAILHPGLERLPFIRENTGATPGLKRTYQAFPGAQPAPRPLPLIVPH